MPHDDSLPEEIGGGLSGPEFMRRLLASLDDRNHQEAFVSAFAPDGQFSLGNVAPVVGPVSIREDIAGIFQAVSAMHHEVLDAWRQDHVVLAEVEVTYTLFDGRIIAMPCLIRVRLEHGAIADMFVAMDRSPSHPFRGQPEAPEHEPQSGNGAAT